jgi:hypothetical protein
MKQYIHSIPGRLRVKTALIKGNEETALHTRKFISQIRGVKSVATNTTTGSITILYNIKTVKSNTLLDILKESNFINDQKTTPHVNKTFSRVGEFVGKFLLGLAIEKTFGYNFLSFVITSIIFF